MSSPGTAAVAVRMWEARAAEGRADEAEQWLRTVAVPAALAAPGCRGAEGFVDDAGLLVLVTRWPAGRHWSEDPPAGLLARENAWTFRSVAGAVR